MKRKGFTLAELLIVVAIVAILAGIAIPLLVGNSKKVACDADVANARSLRSMLISMAQLGQIDFGDNVAMENGTRGVWVLVCKDKDSRPGGYNVDGGRCKDMLVDGTEAVYCGVNFGVSINGEVSTAWNNKNTALHNAIRSYFGNQKLESQNPGYGGTWSDNYGWDWYIVEIEEIAATGEVKCYVYSGQKDADSDVNKNKNSNIEKYSKGIKSAGYR